MDSETDLTEKLSGGVAFRYEDYQEWGDTFDWKVSARYEFTDTFAIRATANSGFRSPTPGQVNTLNVTTTSDSAGNLIPNGTFPVNNPIAVALGAQPLDPEESVSYTAGFVWELTDRTSLSLDWYYISIDDRLALVNLTVGPAEVAELVAAGIPNATPSVDVFEEKDEVVVKAELPGMSKEDIDVKVTDDVITISGEERRKRRLRRRIITGWSVRMVLLLGLCDCLQRYRPKRHQRSSRKEFLK